MWSGRRKNTFRMEMIRNKRIELFFLSDLRVIALCTPFYFCIVFENVAWHQVVI
jgi:hypothetical protein